MDGPSCKGLYDVLILFQNFGWNKTFLIRKIFIPTIISFIQHPFVDWCSFLLLATIKISSNKHLIQLFIFIFACKPSSISLQSHPQDILCTSFQAWCRIQLFLTQICLKNGFMFRVSKNWSQNKNQYPRELGSKFDKTNIGIRISILIILCMPFSAKMDNLTFSE